MTNGKKLLGASILAFLAVTAGSVAFASEPPSYKGVAVEETYQVQMYSSNYDEYYVYALVAEANDRFFREQARIESEKTQARQPNKSVTPNYDPGDGSRWDQLAQCESGGNWAYPPVAGGFSGGIMFHIGTWRSNGGEEFAPDAYLATREQQIAVAERVLAGSGWRAWPGCSQRFGWL